MGKSWKRYPWTYFRCPRGGKSAKINGVRSGSTPPNEWDDVDYDRACWIAGKVALALHKKRRGDDEIVRHLRKKFGYGRKMAVNVIRWAKSYNGTWRRCDCECCKESRNAPIV